jgi:ATP-dependent Clp protease, protease subunit
MPKRLWEIKQSAQDSSAIDMFVYGDVQGDYFDWYSWEQVESETSANHFRNELSKYPDAKQINIYINSYGGSVFEGTAIYSQLKRHPAQKIVHIDGFACSVASVIAMAGDKIIMPKNTMMMIHNAWNVAVGNSKQLRKAADDLDVIMAGNRQAYLEKSNGKITEKKLMELLEAESWLTADQCVEYGLADELLGQETDLTEAKQLLQKMNRTLEQQLSYNKAIAARVRDISQKTEPTPGQDPVPTPPAEPTPIQQTNADKFKAAFKKKMEGK